MFRGFKKEIFSQVKGYSLKNILTLRRALCVFMKSLGGLSSCLNTAVKDAFMLDDFVACLSEYHKQLPRINIFFLSFFSW